MNETKCRSIVKARSMNLCEVGCGRQGIQAHHRKNRSQGGKWDVENILWLCLECHKRITENPAESYHFGWSVRSGFDPSETPVKWCGNWVVLTATGEVFAPPAGSGRCPRCGFHVVQQGHRSGCQVA